MHAKAGEGARPGRSELGHPDEEQGVQAPTARPAADSRNGTRTELRLRRALRAKEEEVESLRRRLSDMESSLDWRLMRRLRPLARRLAPRGSLRYRLTLRILEWTYSALGARPTRVVTRPLRWAVQTIRRRPKPRPQGAASPGAPVQRLRAGCYGEHSWSVGEEAVHVLKFLLALSDFYDVELLLPPGSPVRDKRWYQKNLDIDIGDIEVKSYSKGAEDSYDIWLSAPNERILFAKTPKRFNIAPEIVTGGEDGFLFSSGRELVDPTWEAATQPAVREKLPSDEVMGQKLLSAVAKTDKVSIIIGTHNNLPYLRRALETLLCHTPPGFELIVVNNASEDGTDILLRSLDYPHLKIVNNRANRGFAAFNNQGLRLATRPYVLFLNDDVELTPGWLEPLIEMLDLHPKVGAVGSRLLYPDGRIQHDGKIFLKKDLLPYHVNVGGRPGEDERPVEVDTLTGACLIGRRELVGFDEDYRRGYYEDTDMCLRIKERGYGLVLHRGSVIVHHHAVSMGRNQKATDRAEARNQRIFLERWSAKLPSLVHLATEREFAAGKLRSRSILPADVLSQSWPLSHRLPR